MDYTIVNEPTFERNEVEKELPFLLPSDKYLSNFMFENISGHLNDYATFSEFDKIKESILNLIITILKKNLVKLIYNHPIKSGIRAMYHTLKELKSMANSKVNCFTFIDTNHIERFTPQKVNELKKLMPINTRLKHRTDKNNYNQDDYNEDFSCD